MRHLATLLTALALLSAGRALSQTEPPSPSDGLRDFCAQRPGKATPPCILDAGHLQIETGLVDPVIQNSGGIHEDTYALGATELRLGVSRRVEVEAAWTPLIVDQTRGQQHVSGTGDASLAVLAALSDPDRMGVAVSAQAFVTLPTATHGLGAGGWTGGARLPVAVPLADGLSLGLTPEVDILRNATGGGTHAAWVGVASLGRSFGPLSVGAELWGQVEEDPAGTIRRASADLTGALMIGKSLQLDAGANFGLNRKTPESEFYLGVSRRF
jgi:hypothetical protein